MSRLSFHISGQEEQLDRDWENMMFDPSWIGDEKEENDRRQRKLEKLQNSRVMKDALMKQQMARMAMGGQYMNPYQANANFSGWMHDMQAMDRQTRI